MVRGGGEGRREEVWWRHRKVGAAFWAGESREASVDWLRRETMVEGAAEDMVETLTAESALDLAAATGAGLAKG